MKISDLLADPTGREAEAEEQAEKASAPPPEEQQQYEQVVLAGIKMMTDASDQIGEMLQSQADNPPQALATIGVLIGEKILQATGGELPPVMYYEAMAEILQNVGQFANDSNIFKVDQNIIGLAGQLMFEQLIDKAGINMEDLAILMEETDDETLEGVIREQMSYGNPQAKKEESPNGQRADR